MLVPMNTNVKGINKLIIRKFSTSFMYKPFAAISFYIETIKFL
ncbi:hypothetical protein [Heyndrickxia sp. FSL W8-0423]